MHEVFLRRPPNDPTGRLAREPAARAEAIRLGDCEVFTSLGRIRRRGGPETSVEPKAIEVLLVLLERPGRVVSRAELMEAVWPGRYVTGHVLSRSISALRKALGDDVRSPRYIETIHTRGYRALLPATPFEGGADPAAPAPSPGRKSRLAAAAAWCTAAALVAAGAAWLVASASGRERADRRQRVLRPATAHPGAELDPALSPDGTRLAFSWSAAGGGTGLYVAGLDAAAPVRVAAGAGRQANPSWTSSGGAIAFTRTTARGSGIYLVPARGGADRLLTPTVADDVADLAWSAGGRLLYFADRPHAAAPSAIVRLDTRTLERVPISDPPPWIYGDRDLALSPDGERVVFARATLPGVEDLYLAEPRTRRLRRLTRDGSSINGIEWLPESDEILFSSTRGGSSRLWRIAAAGGEPVLEADLGEGVFDPSYSARASRLVVERRVFDPDVWLLRLAGPRRGERRRVAPSTRWDSAPAISPDGRRLAFVSDRAGSPAIWLSEGDFEGAVRVAALGKPTFGPPVWSPDGARLGIAVVSEGQTDLAVIELDTGAIGTVGTRGVNEVCPLFHPGGRSLSFSSDASGGWEIWRAGLDGHGAERLTRGGALCPRLAPDGETLYYTRPGARGIWRVPAAGGGERRVAGTEWAPPWIDWTVGPGGLYLREAGGGVEPAAVRIVALPGAAAEPASLLIPPSPFPGLGIAVSADARFAAYAAVEDAGSDLIVVDGFR
jgi:Tol biopolymer transport system component/DNA-binding winged helix-turn-helix (wHTH) protein